MDMQPGHGGYLPQQRNRLLIIGGPVSLEQSGEQDGVVGDDDISDQPAALVGDRDVEVGAADQLLFAADLGDSRAQLARLAGSSENGQSLERNAKGVT